MMDNINKLQQQITAIEEEAGKLDPTNYEELYKLLATAYFAAKDIIVLQTANLPVTEDKALKASLRDSEEALSKATTTIKDLTKSNDSKTKTLDQLTAILVPGLH